MLAVVPAEHVTPHATLGWHSLSELRLLGGRVLRGISSLRDTEVVRSVSTRRVMR